jgi:hypothetical protein
MSSSRLTLPSIPSYGGEALWFNNKPYNKESSSLGRGNKGEGQPQILRTICHFDYREKSKELRVIKDIFRCLTLVRHDRKWIFL